MNSRADAPQRDVFVGDVLGARSGRGRLRSPRAPTASAAVSLGEGLMAHEI